MPYAARDPEDLKTLQALRDRHGIAYSQIGRKFYYKPEDVERLLPAHAAEQPPV